jgi:hypothetical protein
VGHFIYPPALACSLDAPGKVDNLNNLNSELNILNANTMKKPSHLIKEICISKLLLIVLLTSLSFIIHAQNINFAAGCPNLPHAVDATVGTDPAIAITAVNAPAGTSTVAITINSVKFGVSFLCGGLSPACGASQDVDGVTASTAGSSASIGGGTLDDTGLIEVILLATATDIDGNVLAECQKTYTINVIRQPVDVMLVLDNSISMNCCTGTNDVTCVTCATPGNSRMDRLKDALDAFLNLGGAGGYFTADDRFGAVIFSGTIDNANATYTSDPLALNTVIQAMPTSSGTCIGGGLIEAVNQMTTQALANRKKAMLLFTDGEQNFNPMLDDASLPVHYEAGDLPVSGYNPAAPNPPYGSCMPFPGSTPTFNTAFRDTNPGITVSTFGFDLPAGTPNTMLSNLANPTNGAGGLAYLGSVPADFTDFFIDHMEEILSGGSPQVVKRISGSTTSGVNEVQFTTNDTLSKVSFLMMGKAGDGNSLRFRVIKDGKDVTQFGRIIDKGSYRLWHINFPIRRPTGAAVDLKPGGTWTLRTSDTQAAVQYRATCIVDDHLLDFDCSFGDPSKHAPGKPIPLSVSLSYSKKPLDSVQRVVVVIERNTNDGGTLLARLAVPEKLRSIQAANELEPAYSNLGQLKHSLLFQTDASYQQALAHVIDTVVLNNNHDGTYSSEYIPEVTGAHKFTFLVDGQDASIGTFEREKMQSGFVRLTSFNLSSDNFTLEKTFNGDVFSGFKLTFTLTDSTGKYLLGPAFERAINLSFKDGVGTTGKITDNLDGSYTVLLTGLDESADPVIDLSIYGTPVFAGPVSELTGGGSHTCPSWIPSFLAKFFHMLGLNCIVGLILLITLIILIVWLIRRKK